MEGRPSLYPQAYARWQRDPEGFWAEAAREIDWYEAPKGVFDPAAGTYGRWFADGVCNTCWNAVDRHVIGGRATQPAIVYDSPLAGTRRVIAYDRLWTEVQILAAVLRDFGVGKGDRVILYMPMVPEAVFGCSPARASGRCIRWCSAPLRRASLQRGSTMPSPSSFSLQAAASSPAV